MRFRYFAAFACAALQCSFTTYGQVSISGSLRGRISDQSNAAIARATITVSDSATIAVQTATPRQLQLGFKLTF